MEFDPKTFADNIFGPEDERKARCIHCETVWYEIHYKDGVCHGCQQKKLPGRSELERRVENKTRFIFAVGVILIIVFIKSLL